MEKVIYNLVFNRKKQLNAEGKALDFKVRGLFE